MSIFPSSSRYVIVEPFSLYSLEYWHGNPLLARVSMCDWRTRKRQRTNGTPEKRTSRQHCGRYKPCCKTCCQKSWALSLFQLATFPSQCCPPFHLISTRSKCTYRDRRICLSVEELVCLYNLPICMWCRCVSECVSDSLLALTRFVFLSELSFRSHLNFSFFYCILWNTSGPTGRVMSRKTTMMKGGKRGETPFPRLHDNCNSRLQPSSLLTKLTSVM